MLSAVTYRTRKSALVSLQISLASALAIVLTAHSAAAQDTGSSTSENLDELRSVDRLQAGEVPVPPPPADSNLPRVEPIISDEEFNASIPPLAQDDPELNEEIESIEEFERRFASEQTDAAPLEGAEAPLAQPEFAHGDRSEEILSLIHISEPTRPY